jgi:hypothetical protein
MVQSDLFKKDSNGNDILFSETVNGKSKYSSLIEKNIIKTESNIPDWIVDMNGMSGKRYRHFINNLISDIEDARYLEIGCWKGSTSCSAIYNNSVDAYCVDNWVEFGGPKNIFCDNVQKCVDTCDDIGITFFESDFRDVAYEEIGKYNVYLFDGPHTQKDQYDGLSYAQPALDDEFIFICDDWNWKKVRDGTFDAIEKLNLNILYSIDIRTTNDDSYPPEENTMEKSDWHNGYYISVLSKN